MTQQVTRDLVTVPAHDTLDALKPSGTVNYPPIAHGTHPTGRNHLLTLKLRHTGPMTTRNLGKLGSARPLEESHSVQQISPSALSIASTLHYPLKLRQTAGPKVAAVFAFGPTLFFSLMTSIECQATSNRSSGSFLPQEPKYLPRER